MTPFILIGVVLLFVMLFFYYFPIMLWFSTKVSGVKISLWQLFLMRFRKVPPTVIASAMVEAHKAGLNSITRDELEAHYLAGGHVERVCMPSCQPQRPTSTFHSRWLLPSTLPVATCSKPYRCQ